MGEDRTGSAGQFTQPFHSQKTPQTNQKHSTQTNPNHELISQNGKKKKISKVNLVLCSSFSPWKKKKVEGNIFVFDGFLLSKSYSRQQLALMHVWVFSATLSPLLSRLC